MLDKRWNYNWHILLFWRILRYNVPLWLWVPVCIQTRSQIHSSETSWLKTSAFYLQEDTSSNQRLQLTYNIGNWTKTSLSRTKLNHTDIREEADCSITYMCVYNKYIISGNCLAIPSINLWRSKKMVRNWTVLSPSCCSFLSLLLKDQECTSDWGEDWGIFIEKQQVPLRTSQES